MKRPDGFDDRPESPAERPSAPSRAERPDRDTPSPERRRGGLGNRLRRAVSRDQGDGLEARVASATDTPDREEHRSAGDLPDLPSVDDQPETEAAREPATLATVTDVFEPLRASRLSAHDADDATDAGSTDADGTDAHTGRDDAAREVPIGAGVRAAETAREARVAARRRRLLERTEVRRFTRRSRHRRAAWITAGSVFVVLVLSVLTAVYSPLMALTTIRVEGTDRVDDQQVRQALSGQLGTPLARVDFGEIKQDLTAFPLIESYVTEEQPPHTLVITVTEREPIVAVQSGKGFDLVDPAGIVVEHDTTKPDTLPLADVSNADLRGSVFRGMTEVVLALPTTVRQTVTQVTASTADDVTLTLNDGSKVVWGNPDESDAKAVLLAALVKDHAARSPGTKVEYDVSAPDNGIIRSQG